MISAILLSGGIDSTAISYWKRPNIAYTIDYGQSSAKAEIVAARKTCSLIGCQHVLISTNLSSLGCGPLAGAAPSGLTTHKEWWPFRNQMLITLAGMHAVQNNVNHIMIGTVSSDSRHKDGTENFIRQINILTKLQEGELEISAPALMLNQLDLVRTSGMPKSAILDTFSCHSGPIHCCDCPGCNKRISLFKLLDLD